MTVQGHDLVDRHLTSIVERVVHCFASHKGLLSDSLQYFATVCEVCMSFGHESCPSRLNSVRQIESLR